MAVVEVRIMGVPVGHRLMDVLMGVGLALRVAFSMHMLVMLVMDVSV